MRVGVRKPELRHACVQRSAGFGGIQKGADPIVMINPSEEASTPVDGERGGAIVVSLIFRHQLSVHVEVAHLPNKGPARGPKLSVRNLLSSPVGRAPGATHNFNPPARMVN